jgi:hypothetical protein
VPAVLDATTTQCRQVTSSSGLTAKAVPLTRPSTTT